MGIKIGDKNKITNSNIIENTNININEKQKDGFWKSVFVNIMSNFLWKVLGVLGTLGLLMLYAWASNA